MGKGTSVVGLRKPTEIEGRFLTMLGVGGESGVEAAQKVLDREDNWEDLYGNAAFKSHINDYLEQYVDEGGEDMLDCEPLHEIETMLLEVEIESDWATAACCEDMVETVDLSKLPEEVEKVRFRFHR